MVMVRVNSLLDIENFPKSKWGIPEPTDEYIRDHPDVTGTPGAIDVVLVPGVAFDRNCARLGHGKGYYGNKINCIVSA